MAGGRRVDGGVGHHGRCWLYMYCRADHVGVGCTSTATYVCWCPTLLTLLSRYQRSAHFSNNVTATALIKPVHQAITTT